jgi:hypothetical protein
LDAGFDLKEPSFLIEAAYAIDATHVEQRATA